ncbi:hypothetical protein ABN028_16175 [Actinopolymorpha sp. B17G11]|uniref:hypothetical protein n=1 Tax=Actinopolymorpha sp. B17G11 TaxID=3160861 RepID=UPI0032E49371
MSKGWVSKLLTRYKVEGQAAFGPRSRRRESSPTAIPDHVVEQIVRLRKDSGRVRARCRPAHL